MANRFRADEIELAWAIEKRFGLPPGANDSIGSATDGLEGAVGLVTAGVTLPDPRYEWEPFYGVGVVDRNFNFPIQGREIFEGSISTIYLTHNNSRLFMEQIFGVIFNATTAGSQVGAVTTTNTTLTDAGRDFSVAGINVKNNASWTTGVTAGTAGVSVLLETAGGGVAAAADQTNATNDSNAAVVSWSVTSTTDRLYIGASSPFTQIRIDFQAAGGGAPTVNLIASTMTAEFSDGSGVAGTYVAGGISLDGTAATAGVPFGQDGIIVLDPPPGWGRNTHGAAAINRYWVRLSFATVPLTAAITIDDIDVWANNPHYMIIVSPLTDGTLVDRWKDVFAFIGPARGTTVAAGTLDTETTVLNVYADYGLTRPGWHGKAPPTSGAIRYSIFNTRRDNVAGVIPDVTNGTADIRESIFQPSFTLAARFTKETGGRFTTNYMGNKINRATFNFEENRPVTFNVDFTGQDMRHNLGTASTVIKFSSDVVNPTFRRVNEQPYFFSRADLRFGGTTFARFRRLALVVDNQLDSRYYTTQSTYVDRRQTLYEILEGRRRITLTGVVDLDDTVNDAQFLRWLLNQGVNTGDVRTNTTLQGIVLAIRLERLQTAGAAPSFDRMIFTLPSGTLGTNNAGLIFNSARHPIPAPPDVHHPLDLDIIASSIQVEVSDSIT